MPKTSKLRTELDRGKTYFKAIIDWASLPSETKKIIPNMIFLNSFYLTIFNLS